MTTVPRPMRWTCAEFHRLGDHGHFEGRGAMLVDGVILEEGRMSHPHAVALGLVDDALRPVFRAGWRFRHRLPLVLAQDIDPVPDFAVLPGSPRDETAHPTTAALVVEVADSSLAFDTQDKRLIYARASIPEYWVVDVNGRRLLVFRDPSAGDYATRAEYGPADTVSPLAVPSGTIAVADLLP